MLSTQEPYQLALKDSNLHFVSSAAKIWEYLLQYQNKINDYLVSNEQNPLTLLQDKMPAKEGATSPLSLTRLTNWFTEQAESYKNNNGNKEVNVQSKFPFFSKPESVKPHKKVAQPDDVALLLTLAKTFRINLEFKKSDPGMFINCFNLLNSLVGRPYNKISSL